MQAPVAMSALQLHPNMAVGKIVFGICWDLVTRMVVFLAS